MDAAAHEAQALPRLREADVTADLPPPPVGFTASGAMAARLFADFARRHLADEEAQLAMIVAYGSVLMSEALLKIVEGLVTTPLASPAYAEKLENARRMLDEDAEMTQRRYRQ